MANEKFNIDVILNDSKFQSGVRNMTQGLRQVGNESKKTGSMGQQMGASFGTAFKSMAQIGAVVGGFALVSTAIKGVVKEGMEYTQQMSKVEAVSGATAFEMTQLGVKARELGATTNWSAKNVAEGFEYMALAGFDTGQMLEGITPMLNLATAGALDLGKAADIVTDTMTPFNMKAEEAGRVADVMAIAQASANLNVEMLGETMKYAAPVANAFGMSLEDTTNIAMQFANGGIKASMAGTALRSGLSRLAEPPKPASKALKELGIQTTNTDGTMRTMREIIEQLTPAFGKLTNQQQIASAKAIFGEEAYAGWMMVINNGLDTWDEFDDILQTSAGSADVMAKIMANNLTGATNSTMSAMKNLGLVLFSRVEGGLISATKGVGSLTDAMTNWLDPAGMAVEANDFLKKIEQERAMGLELLKMRLDNGKISEEEYNEGKKRVNETYEKQRTEAGRVEIQLRKLDEQLEAGKITQEEYDQAKAEAELHSKKLGEAIKQEEAKQKQYGEVIKWLQDVFKSLWKYVEPMWKDMTKFIGDCIKEIKDFIENNGEEIKAFWDFVWGIISSVTGTVWEGIKSIIKGAMHIIMGIIQVVGGIINGDWGKVWEGVKNIGSGIWDVITGLFDATFVKGLIKGVLKMGKGVLKGVTEWFGKKVDAIKKYMGLSVKEGDTGGNGIVKAIGKALKTLVKVVTSPFKSALKGITDMGKSWATAGKNLMTDLINGITSKMKSLGSKVKEVGSMMNPMNWFRSFAATPDDLNYSAEYYEAPRLMSAGMSSLYTSQTAGFAEASASLSNVLASNLTKGFESGNGGSVSESQDNARPIEITVVSELDGREVARGTARYDSEEINGYQGRITRGTGGRR